MEYNMEHVSAEKAYSERTDVVDDYYEFEKLVHRVHHALNKAPDISGTQALDKRDDARSEFRKATNKMLDNKRIGNWTNLQGNGENVHCASALVHLRPCADMLDDIKGGDWGQENELKNVLFDKNPGPVVAINKIIKACEEVLENSQK